VAKRKSGNSAAIIGGVVFAVFGGIVLAVSVFNAQDETPLPAPPKIDLNTPYDDEWGKLATADSAWTVTHILVSWTGSGVTTKKPRTKEEARKLIDELWARFRNNPTKEYWTAMQKEFNEDGKPYTEYSWPLKTGQVDMVPEFKRVAQTTKASHARIVESQFGFHLIRRER